MGREILSSGTICENLRHVLEDDGRAMELARRLDGVARHGDVRTVLRELLLARRAFERLVLPHFADEERELFPLLAARGLEREVAEAKRQHQGLRALYQQLAGVAECDARGAREKLAALASELAAHVRHESEMVCRDLFEAEQAEYRDDIDLLLADAGGG
jgi:hypothetical protein